MVLKGIGWVGSKVTVPGMGYLRALPVHPISEDPGCLVCLQLPGAELPQCLWGEKNHQQVVMETPLISFWVGVMASLCDPPALHPPTGYCPAACC